MRCEKVRCVECGEPVDDDDAESTYCGSCCQECLSDHCDQCSECRRDFFPDRDGDEEDE